MLKELDVKSRMHREQKHAKLKKKRQLKTHVSPPNPRIEWSQAQCYVCRFHTQYIWLAEDTGFKVFFSDRFFEFFDQWIDYQELHMRLHPAFLKHFDFCNWCERKGKAPQEPCPCAQMVKVIRDEQPQTPVAQANKERVHLRRNQNQRLRTKSEMSFLHKAAKKETN